MGLKLTIFASWMISWPIFFAELQEISLFARRNLEPLQDIAAQDYILTPGRYVGIAEQEDDGEPFADKMQRLTSELSGLFKESHRLEDKIKKQLGNIGFEIE